MENQSQVRKRSIVHFRQKPANLKKPSFLHILRIIISLAPIVIYFRRDRRDWVKHEGKGVNEEKYKKHAVRALRTFVRLGPSYIKLGQWLSSRADILPQPYLEVLAQLQDNVPPADFEQVKPIIEEEIGQIDRVFENFNTTALSGASLGQVYLAQYKNQQILVKVSRPRIEDIIEQDICVLKKILPLATRFIDPNLRFSAQGMLLQFIETIHEEMDYRVEAMNLKTIKNNLKDDPMVIIPSVIEGLVSKHVLALDYIPGIKITDIAALDSMGVDRERLVVRIHHVFFRMLLRHSIFHADPHPGNISVADNGAIILYDFGMVGKLDNETRIRLIRLYLGLIDKDAPRTVDVLMELGTLDPAVNRYIVEKGLDLSIQSLHGRQVDRMEVKALMDLANKTMSRFPFKLPKNLALYMRMASILEGIYHHHNVRFQFVKVLVNLLEEEGLLREAYMEELRLSLKRFAKGVEDSTSMAPLLKTFLENNSLYQQAFSQKSHDFIAASIFASGLFIGSAMLFPHNPSIAFAGFSFSGIITIIALVLRRKIR